MSEERIPIETVLPQMGLHPLPEGWTPVEAFVVIKALDGEGDLTWVYRTTAAPNRYELLGALDVHTAVLRKELVDEWDEDDE